MPLDLVLMRKTDEALQRFDAFVRSISIPTEEKTGRFYHIFTALSTVSVNNYVSLRNAWDRSDQMMLAWSCRNLLELAIFTKYALMSEANADEFADARLVDGIQIGTRLKQLELYLNPHLASSAFDDVINRFSTQMSAEGVTQTKYLSTGQLAGTVGMKEDYDAMNQVCSKFVHPTAWSILTEDIGAERFPDAHILFYTCGAQYFATVMAEVKPHIRKWGLKHKP
jgi:hypothetical protein